VGNWKRNVTLVAGALSVGYDDEGESNSNPPGNTDPPDQVNRPANSTATVLYKAKGGITLTGIQMCDGSSPLVLSPALSSANKHLTLTDAAAAGVNYSYYVQGTDGTSNYSSTDPQIHNEVPTV
jgi:hypothetical protein